MEPSNQTNLTPRMDKTSSGTYQKSRHNLDLKLPIEFNKTHKNYDPSIGTPNFDQSKPKV